MADLKQEIARIQQAVKENQGKYPGVNKWYEITKIAYERGELINLLSGEDEYIYDANGELWLRSGGPDADLDKDPIAIRTVVAAGIYDLYRQNRSQELKDTLVDVFNKMLSGTSKQVYFAVQIFYQLALDDANKQNPLSRYYFNEFFSDLLRHSLESTILLRKEEFSKVSLFNTETYKDGFIGWMVKRSQWLEELCSRGFM